MYVGGSTLCLNSFLMIFNISYICLKSNKNRKYFQKIFIKFNVIDLVVWCYDDRRGEPASLTPTWVHFDKRFGRPACGTAGYPLLRRGSISTYVLIAQDGLNTLGFRTGGLDRNIWNSNKKCSN